MNSIRYKFISLLTEGYNFTTADEVMSAVKANQVGVKIDQSFKTDQGSIPTKLAFKHFFEKCQNLGIKDTTYGVQILLSKTTRETIGYAVAEDAIYEFLKSYRKPWVKQLPEYKLFMDGKYNKDTWHKLEKAIQDNQAAHGKAAKGSGQLKDVKVAYDDGAWKLLIPSSFEGEKAAAFYIKDGKETPTEWCTRCDKYYYDYYTQLGPLYIIRNMKTGKSYQLAFTSRSVEFLDQNDEKGDEITTGDLNPIPDNLLKLIKHPKNGRTLLDYKSSRNKALSAPKKKGYLKSDNVGTGPGSFKYGPAINLGSNVYKKDILNFSTDDIKDALSNYFTNERKVEVSLEYAKKHKATAYFIKGKENAMLILQTGKGYGKYEGKMTVNGAILQTAAWECLTDSEQTELWEAANKDFGVTKNREREEALQDRKNGLMKKYNTKSENITQKDYDKLVDNINSRLDFRKSKLFKGLSGFTPTPRFGRTGEWGTKAMYGNTLVKELYFIPTRDLTEKLSRRLRNEPVCVMFKKKIEGETNKWSSNVPWAKADTAILITGYEPNDFMVLSDQDFAFCKKVSVEIQKEIIKDPDYRKTNMQRKIEQEAQSQKERSGKVLTKQQLEKTVGKDMAHRLTHLDNEKPGVRFPVHVMKSINQAAHRPELYEDYFPY